MGNTEFKKKKGFGAKWVWIVVPLIAAIVAIAVSSKTSSKISLFGVIGSTTVRSAIVGAETLDARSDPQTRLGGPVGRILV
ncbi:endoplasmic oxidoreductin-1-like, partial [Trifolium medium]|nr:endoplasmic oxidoreductin-1-like [Trifolium medium]